jgi:hypothetical protein
MKNAVISLVKKALLEGNTVSVWNGEEWAVKSGKYYKPVMEEIKAVEMAELVIRDADANKVGWALVSLYGLEPDETVIDCTDNKYMAKLLEEV